MANILIVDDDVDTIAASKALLESAGHEVRTGADGEEGLLCLAAGPLPDCLVLDVEMPVLGGPGMARRMALHREGEEGVPILLVSGRDDLAAVAARMGTPYFLAKSTPDYGSALLTMLRRALRERQPPSRCSPSPTVS